MTQKWPVIGRGEELATIMEWLRGGVGSVVVGEAGIGKTVLALEVQRRMETAGWRTELVRCGGRRDFPLDTRMPLLDSAFPALLVVDDAHLLNDESAEALWRIATAGTTRVLATLRSGEHVPDRVARMWSGDSCRRLNLQPLAEADIRELLEQVLGGDVEDRLPHALVQRAAGNALLLRELIRFCIDSGAIARRHAVWRLTGPMPIGDGVTDLIRASLSGLGGAELEAAQLIALGEPLRLAVAIQALGEAPLEALESADILHAHDSPNGPAVGLARIHARREALIARVEVRDLRLRPVAAGR